jgi:hypothetical protein
MLTSYSAAIVFFGLNIRRSTALSIGRTKADAQRLFTMLRPKSAALVAVYAVGFMASQSSLVSQRTDE